MQIVRVDFPYVPMLKGRWYLSKRPNIEFFSFLYINILDKWSNVLVASGFEIYGVLKEKTTVQQNVVENVKEFVSHLIKGIEQTQQTAITNKHKHVIFIENSQLIF